MWLSHLISLKVTDLSNTMRITSFNHCRTATSPINTGGLCTPVTKPAPGSVLHTSETDCTLKGRWHMGHRKILSAKQSLCLEQEKGEESIHAAEIECCLALTLWHGISLASPSNAGRISWTHWQGEDKNGSTLSRDCNAEDQNNASDIPMKNLP